MTIRSSGTTTVSNIEGCDADDKFFRVNAASMLNVTHCLIHRAAAARCGLGMHRIVRELRAIG